MDKEKKAAHARGHALRSQALQMQKDASELQSKQVALEHKIERLEKALSSLKKDLRHIDEWKRGLLKLKTNGDSSFCGSRRDKANKNVDQAAAKLSDWLDAHEENKEVVTKKLRELQAQSQDLQMRTFTLNNEATVLFSNATYLLNM